MDSAQLIVLAQKIAIMAIPLIFAITIHEVAHGWVASRLGDKTALMMGRITLNPIKHIDPVGTILVPGLLMYMGGIIFGWAKPVPVNYRNLKQPRRDMALVAIAGPISNLIMALMWGGILKFSLYILGLQLGNIQWLVYMAFFGIWINLILMVLNFLPIPPLDGSRVVSSFLPSNLSYYYDQVEQFGFIILVALIYTGILGRILIPPVLYMKDQIISLYFIPQALVNAIMVALFSK